MSEPATENQGPGRFDRFMIWLMPKLLRDAYVIGDPRVQEESYGHT